MPRPGEARRLATLPRWDRASQAVLESLLLLTMLLAIVSAVLGTVEVLVDGDLVTTVELDPAQVDLPATSDVVLAAGTAELTVADPGPGQVAAFVAPHLLIAAVVGATAWLLLGVLRSLRDGDPFHQRNARRLGVAGLVVALGGTAASFAQSIVSLDIALDAADAYGPGGPVLASAGVSFLPLGVALALAVLAEFFRRGSLLRDDVEGLV